MNSVNFRKAFFITSAALLLVGGIGLLLVGGIGGYWLAQSQPTADIAGLNNLADVLHADSAAGGKTVSTATGRLDENTECLFVLDHQTGILSCLIINPRNALTGGVYIANVATQMKLDKLGDLDFVMVTGYNAFGIGGRTGNLRPANCVCYVVEGNSGRAVAYSLTYDRTVMVQGGVQQGALEVVWQGSFRPENLRRN